MVVSCVANLGDISTVPSRRIPSAGYFTRRLRAPPTDAYLDWLDTAERPIVTPNGKQSGKGTDAQYRGLLFERKATDALGVRYGNQWLPQAVFRFRTPREIGKAIPDGILFSAKEIIVVEMKFNFRRADLGQLEDFYLPIVKCAFPTHAVSGLIVCKNLLEYNGIRGHQVLYDRCGLESLRVRRFTQFLIVGRSGFSYIAGTGGLRGCE